MFLPIVPLKILKVGGLEESDWAAEPQPSRSLWASTNRPIRATRNTFTAATSTTSSGTAFRRSSGDVASAWLTRAKNLKDLAYQPLPRAERRCDQPVICNPRKLRGFTRRLLLETANIPRGRAGSRILSSGDRCRLMPIFLQRGALVERVAEHARCDD